MNPNSLRASAIVGVLVSSASIAMASAAVALAPRPGMTDGTTAAEPIPSDKKTSAWAPAPARQGEIVYSSLGIRSMPAPDGAVPAISLGEVLSRGDVEQFVSQGLAVGEPRSSLRLITTGDFGPSEGQPIIGATDQLAWVLSFRHSPAAVHGPYGASPVDISKLDCDFVVMIDAVTGHGLSYAQLCPPP